MKSLKRIINEHQDLFEEEQRSSDISIVLTYIRENFDFQFMDYIILLCKDNAMQLTHKVEQLQEHQSWNIATYTFLICDKLYNDLEKKGEIQPKNWPFFNALCLSYMDLGKSVEEVSPYFRGVIKQVKDKIASEDIKNWVDGKC